MDPNIPFTATCDALADTGCTTMLAGLSFVHNLGLKKSDLVPVRTEIKAANRSEIRIIGAIIVEIKLHKPRENGNTKQVVYITDMIDRVFLSLEACIQLGLIGESFPNMKTSTMVAGEVVSDKCNCLPRTLPPPLPKEMPFPEHEKEKLKDWLLDRYASSTFNVCTHQPIPTMSGEPMRLIVDPNAVPYVAHTPAPVPVHFREEVKRQLDEDVRLGVIEPVPPNTPVRTISHSH